jgi:hypothetical protein
MRFLMSRYVSKSQPRGYVNYEELIKFLAQCLGKATNTYQDYVNILPKYQNFNSNYELTSDSDYLKNTGRRLF